jgi:putative zinc finger protein
MSRVDCFEVEQFLSEFLENRLEEPALQSVRSHLDACESCRALTNDMRLGLALCRSFPELEPPARLVDAILDKTSGHFRSLSWKEYVRELFRPLYMSPRFATGTCLAAISFFIVMNAFGIHLTRMAWSDLNPRTLLVNIHRTVYLAYDNGLRRINDLRILYQIQSKIDELRTRETQTTEKPKEKPKETRKPDETSSTEYLVASRPSIESRMLRAGINRKQGIVL